MIELREWISKCEGHLEDCQVQGAYVSFWHLRGEGYLQEVSSYWLKDN